MFRTALTGLFLAAFSTSAFAGDMYSSGSLKDVPVVPPLWTGFYVGAHGGGTTESDLDFHTRLTGTPGQKLDGGFGGIQWGYNWQFPSGVVVGIESDVSFGDFNDKVHDGTSITETSEMNVFGTSRTRLGYSILTGFGAMLPYVTSGLSWANVELGENCPPGVQFGHCRPVAAGGVGPYSLHDTETFFGWTVGGGLEVMVGSNWSLKVEYLHLDLGTQWFQFDGPASPRAPDLTLDTVKGGINYRFGGGFEPLK